MAGTNQIFTIVAFALLVVLVLGLGLLVAILVQRRRTKKAKAASELRKAERRRAAHAGVAGLHEDTETSGGISLLGLSVQQAVPESSVVTPSSPPLWAAAPRPVERPAAWLPASVQQASAGYGAPAPTTVPADARPGTYPLLPGAREPHGAQVASSQNAHADAPEPAPDSGLAGPAVSSATPPAPHSYSATFSGGSSPAA